MTSTITTDSISTSKPPSSAASESESYIDLSPSDFYRVPGKDRPFKVRPAPQPFDYDDACRRLALVTSKLDIGYPGVWNNAELQVTMSRHEAHFWLIAISSTGNDPRLRVGSNFSGNISSAEVCSLAKDSAQELDGVLWAPLTNLISLSEILVFFASSRKPTFSHGWRIQNQFKLHSLPYLSETEFSEAGETVRQLIGDHPSTRFNATPFWLLTIGGYLGLYSELRSVVATWPAPRQMIYSGFTASYYEDPRDVVFGLGNARIVEDEMRRTLLCLTEEDHVREWLAFTGLQSLDYVRDSILFVGSGGSAEPGLLGLARVHAPEAAPYMLELKLKLKNSKIPRRWLIENTVHAIRGLLPIAVGTGEMTEAAVDYLRGAMRRGYQSDIESAVELAEPQTAACVRKSVIEFILAHPAVPELNDDTTPPVLDAAIKECSKLKPTFATTDPHRPVLLRLTDGQSTRRLNASQTDKLLSALAAQKNLDSPPHPLVSVIKELAEPKSLEEFAWSLFDAWIDEGVPPKGRWAMMSIGFFGADKSVLKLTPMIKAWPGESQHARAVLGLEVLRTIGSDLALMQISAIAQKVPFKGLKTSAGLCLERIAAERKLTRPQLEDRIIPQCDLDSNGSRVFDFGPRQFHFALGRDLKPTLRDNNGKLAATLPKPNSKDDPEMAELAIAEWKLTKKIITDVAKVQASRLEEAMVTGRRWPFAEFESLLLRHPLMVHIVRRLIWATYGQNNAIVTAFRITEDLSFADDQDNEVHIDSDATVGVVHPLSLTEPQKQNWNTIVTDYLIVPPFLQIGRPVRTLDPGEKTLTQITRFARYKLPTRTLISNLEKRGWTRGQPLDAGIVSYHSKYFLAGDVTAVLDYPGFPVSDPEMWDNQSLDCCSFFAGSPNPDWGQFGDPVILGTVGNIAVSEVLSDLEFLTSKASDEQE